MFWNTRTQRMFPPTYASFWVQQLRHADRDALRTTKHAACSSTPGAALRHIQKEPQARIRALGIFKVNHSLRLLSWSGQGLSGDGVTAQQGLMRDI
jgi:hypothetical protein